MSILIKGMDMPKEDEISKCVIIRHDGEVWNVEFDTLVNEFGYVACYPSNPMRAVPVPPHGRLIDADALADVSAKRLGVINIGHIDNAPTVIPAEEEKDDEKTNK